MPSWMALENSGLNPVDFLILALAAGPIKGCSTIAELRWWVEPFLTNNFAVATPMLPTLLVLNVYQLVTVRH